MFQPIGKGLLQPLDHDGAAATAAVADGGGAEGCVLLLQHVDERRHDARAAAADGVAQGDGTAIHVHGGQVQAEQLGVGKGLQAEESNSGGTRLVHRAVERSPGS